MESPPNIEIEEDNFKRAWAKLVLKIMQKGMELPTEYKNMSKDACTRVTLTGRAIDQILNKDLHPHEPFGRTRIKEYLQQYTREYDWMAQGFEYTYMERFINYPPGIDQLAVLREKLKDGITRRAQIITWVPERDLNTEHPPCLQRIWIRPLSGKTCEVHLSWRSRDAYGAWSSNLCGIIDMLYREVLAPNNLKIVKLVDFCSSAHIYDSDWEAANRVRLP
jgi:thymidylate synthase